MTYYRENMVRLIALIRKACDSIIKLPVGPHLDIEDMHTIGDRLTLCSKN